MPDSEDLTLTVLRGVTGFTGTTSTTINTGYGKWGLLNSGNSDHYGIIKPGETDESQGAMSMNITLNQIIIQIWQRYVDDGDSLANLKTHVANVKNYFDTKRRLGDTSNVIVDAFITSKREVAERWNKDGALVWLSRDLVLTVEEHNVITYAE